MVSSLQRLESAGEALCEFVDDDRDGLSGDVDGLELLAELHAARFFAKRYGDRIRFCAKAGGWFVWDQRRWAKDDDGAVLRLAHAAADEIATWAGGCADLEQRKKILGFAIALQKRRGIENVVALAQSLEAIAIGNPARFDANPWALNVANGTLDLQSGRLRPHDPEQLITRIVSINFDPAARCDRWLSFLDEIFAGDAETIGFVQRAVGYTLTGSATEQVFFILHGLGANGKTTFLSVLSDLLGEYGLSTKPETFVDRKAGSATNDLARLHGARFVSSIEVADGHALAESFVKAVTGGDRISARYLYGEYFDFEPTFKLWLGTNHKPVVRGVDEGIWRRIRMIPFEQRFQGDRCDPDLRAKLGAELPGILAWAVHGCLEWQRQRLGSADAVRVATSAYRLESDTFATFLDERCVVEPHAIARAGELFAAFQQWAEANGERPVSQQRFGRRLSDRGFSSERAAIGRLWRGIGLRDEADHDAFDALTMNSPKSLHARA